MPSALPAGLQPAWDAIQARELLLARALDTGDFAALEPLAADRHDQIQRFFTSAELESAGAQARLALLQELIARNEALLEDSRVRLGAVSGASAQARHNRRAVDAYQQHDR